MKKIGTAALLHNVKDHWVPLPVEVVWLHAAADWAFLADWQSLADKSKSTAARDSLEYATLAGKRWRYLSNQSLAATSLPGLRQLLSESPSAEIGLALGLRTVNPPRRVLGFAFVRRTWANNVMLEFLAASPAAEGGFKGVGRTLMQTLSIIALSLRCGALWGECTELSHGFYTSLKSKTAPAKAHTRQQHELPDRFVFTAAELVRIAKDSQVKIEGCEPGPENES